MVKKLQIALIALLVLALPISGIKIKRANAVRGIVVVLDAGHGGIDAGVVSSQGVKESDLNLDICYKVKNELEKYCISVVMTRNGVGGLYGLATKGFKRRDMKKRKEIIEQAKPNMVVSIHINKCPYPYRKGAQVFYKIADEKSKKFALKLQAMLNELPNSDKDNMALAGDYYLLNCHNVKSVLIECGFFSNEENEKQLLSEEYRFSLAGIISAGVLNELLINP